MSVGSVALGLDFGESLLSLLSQRAAARADLDLVDALEVRHATIKCRNQLAQAAL
jgi:hypothetical protein